MITLHYVTDNKFASDQLDDCLLNGENFSAKRFYVSSVVGGKAQYVPLHAIPERNPNGGIWYSLYNAKHRLFLRKVDTDVYSKEEIDLMETRRDESITLRSYNKVVVIAEISCHFFIDTTEVDKESYENAMSIITDGKRDSIDAKIASVYDVLKSFKEKNDEANAIRSQIAQLEQEINNLRTKLNKL